MIKLLNTPLLVIATLLGLFLNTVTNAQQTDQKLNVCTQVLKNAQKSYDGGRISEVPPMLEECLKEGFSRSEKLQALRLVILSYLFQDEDEKAEATLLLLLKEDPEYKVNEALDPAEFINLYNQYRTLPIISIGLIGGVNQSRINESTLLTTDNANSVKKSYKPAYGYQFGLMADILIRKNFQVNTGFVFSGRKYEIKQDLMFNYSNLDLVESQTWLDLPLALKYNFGKKKFVPYIMAGATGGMIVSSNASIARVSINGDNDASGPIVSLKNLRNKFNYSALLGLGAKYKLGYGYLSLDLRYNMGLHDISNAKKRYSSNELLYYYGYIDSNFKLNNFSVSVGYYKSIYKPKKISKK